jgi:hypothetical protein
MLSPEVISDAFHPLQQLLIDGQAARGEGLPQGFQRGKSGWIFS